MSVTQAQLNYTQTMYIAYYGRPADPGGLQFWASRLASDGPAGIANAFGTSEEFNNNYGSLSPAQLVDGLFRQLLGRGADPEGLAFYEGGLQSGAFTLPDIALRIIDGVQAGSGDDLVVANRLQVANYVTNLVPDTALLSTIIDLVDGGVASVEQALAALGIDPQERERFDLSIGDENQKVGTVSFQQAPPTALMITSGQVVNVEQLRSDPRFSEVDGRGYTVVVLDTGIDLDHPAFGPDANGDGVADRIVFHRDFSGEGDGTADDVQGHGTHVASTVGSSEAAYPGVAPGVNIVALQVLDNNGSGGSQGIERALQWVIANQSAFNIVAVNLSLGDNSNLNSPISSYASDEFTALQQLGVITIAAAGNSYFEFQAEGVSYPAADPNAIAVGATFDANVGFFGGGGPTAFTTDVDRLVPFSQRSDVMTQIFAPGAIITGAAPGGGSVGLSGTSMAAPHIAGIAALAQQIADQYLGRRLSPDEFLNLLTSTAVIINDGDDEDDNVVNTGDNYNRVDVLALANAIVALGGGGVAPPPVDNRDTIAGDPSTTATLPLGNAVAGTIDTRGDTDWYRVALEEDATYQFSLTGTTLADPWLGLHGPDGEFITSNNDSGGSLNASLTFIAPATGIYFLSAEAFGPAQTGDYLIEASLANIAFTDAIPGDASTTTDLLNTAALSSAIDFGGDEDWLRLSLQAGVTYTITVSGETSGGGTLTDPVLELFDAGSSSVAFDDDSGPGLEPLLNFTPQTSGIFYAEVRAFGASQTGSYTVSLSGDELSSDGDTIAADPSTARTLESGGEQQSAVDSAGDEDWFRISLSAGREYVFELAGSGSNPLADPFLSLYDDSGALLATDDDGGMGLNARLAVTPEVSGVYYLGARGFGSTVGQYTLSADTGQGGAGDNINGMGIGDAGGTRSTAAMVSAGGDGRIAVTGSVGYTGDTVDYFELRPSADGIASFALGGLGADLDLVLENASGEIVEGSYAAGANPEMLTTTLTGGEQYFLRVDPFGSAASAYTLDITLPTNSSSGPQDSVNGVPVGDAGGNLGNAVTLPAAEVVNIVGSTGFGADDGDMYRLVADASGAASFILSGLRSDIDLALYSASGSLLAASTVTGTGAESINFPLSAGNTYFLYVYPFTDASEYSLQLQLPVAATGASETVNSVAIGDAADSELSPTTITLDSQGRALVTGSTGANGDGGDFFGFVAPGTGAAAFELFGLQDDLDLVLLDANGSLLVYEPALGADSERLTLGLQAGEQYVVGVFPWDGAVSSYTLTIDAAPADSMPDVINGVAIADAGDLENPYVLPGLTSAIMASGTTGGPDTSDAIVFIAQQSGPAAFSLQTLQTDADLDLYLYDSSGEMLASGINSGNAEEFFEISLVGGAQYTLIVSPFSGASAYELTMSA